MNYFYKTLIFALFYKIESLKCVMDSYNWCSFTNVIVNSTQRLFQPNYDYPYIVEKVRFYNSRLEILTDELCITFYNLRELEIWNVQLKHVEVGALDNCIRLQWISFWSNNLRTLDAATFQYNKNLRTLSIQKNQFKSVDPEMFKYLPNLRHLSLNDNFLRVFPVYEMDFLNNLEIIHVDNNELSDLDEQEMLYKLPNLKIIYLNDNPLMCNRLRVILSTFRRNEIDVKRANQEHRLRDIKLDEFFEGDCLPEDYYGHVQLKQEIYSIKRQKHNIDQKVILPNSVNRFIRGFQDIQKNTEMAIFDLHLDLNEVTTEINSLKLAIRKLNETLEHIQDKVYFTNNDLVELIDEFHIINSTQDVLFKFIENMEVALEELKNDSYQGEWDDLAVGNEFTNIS